MKNYTPKFAILLLSLSATVFSGCVGESKSPSTYVLEKNIKNDEYNADIFINDHRIRCNIDTGALGIHISKKDAKRAGIEYKGDAHYIDFKGKVSSTDEVIFNNVRIANIEQTNVKGIVDPDSDFCVVGSLYLKRAYDWIWVENSRMHLVNGKNPSTFNKKEHETLTIDRQYFVDGKVYNGNGSQGWNNSRFNTRVFIDGVKVECLIDTGAFAFVIDEKQAKRIGIKINDLLYTGTATTVEGKHRIANYETELIQMGGFINKGFPIKIISNADLGCAIGMTYLDTFDEILIGKNKMTFVRY